jgi:hypothetical protein
VKAVQEHKPSDEKEQKKDQDDIADRKQLIAVQKTETDDLKQQMQSLSATRAIITKHRGQQNGAPRPHLNRTRERDARRILFYVLPPKVFFRGQPGPPNER